MSLFRLTGRTLLHLSSHLALFHFLNVVFILPLRHVAQSILLFMFLRASTLPLGTRLLNLGAAPGTLHGYRLEKKGFPMTTNSSSL